MAMPMKGDTNVPEKLFFTRVMRLGRLFKKLPKSDGSKCLERETPFTNINLSHVISNVVLGYQAEKEISVFVKRINGDPNITAQDCLQALKTIEQLLKCERKYIIMIMMTKKNVVMRTTIIIKATIIIVLIMPLNNLVMMDTHLIQQVAKQKHKLKH